MKTCWWRSGPSWRIRWLGKGANAQENCYIINSRLEGYNVTAHGAKIIEADLGKNVFVGFNAFLRGRPERRLTIGKDSIIMPHTIIDIRKPLTIPPGHLVWGLIRNTAGPGNQQHVPQRLCQRSIHGSAKALCSSRAAAAAFVSAFQERIHHILEANGAFFDGKPSGGHAQRNQNISFNTIQPYPEGDKEGLYPHHHHPAIIKTVARPLSRRRADGSFI